MAKNKYPGVYARRQKLWIKYYDAKGEVVRESTGLTIGKEKQAAEIRRSLMERIEQSKRIVSETGAEPSATLTLARYGHRWVKARQQRGVSSAGDDETRFRLHVNPRLVAGRPFGEMPLEEVRPRHVRDLVRSLKEEGELAPRTVRNVYGMLHALFVDAKLDELVVSNPCELPREALPKRVDKNPLWRATAKFSRDEVERLISDERIPWDRRVINAILFLGACRWGEMAALRWREFEPRYEGGLGRIVFARSFDHKKRRIKSVKTEVPRWMPVHPTLAEVLAEWKLGGWAAMMGRMPTPDDLVVPNAPVLDHSSGIPLRLELQRAERERVRDLAPDAIEHCRRPQLGLKRAKEDCQVLGLRGRRNHDARRTFISLARAGGARTDILKWVTHGQSQSSGGESGIMDVYTTFPWSTLCEQVLCVKIDLLEGKVIELPPAATARATALAPVGDEAAQLTGTRLGTRAANDAELPEKEGGAYRIRTCDFHRVRMALYR